MSQEKSSELNKTPQTSAGAPAKDTESDTNPSVTAVNATQNRPDTPELDTASEPPTSSPVERSVDSHDWLVT